MLPNHTYDYTILGNHFVLLSTWAHIWKLLIHELIMNTNLGLVFFF